MYRAGSLRLALRAGPGTQQAGRRRCYRLAYRVLLSSVHDVDPLRVFTAFIPHRGFGVILGWTRRSLRHEYRTVLARLAGHSTIICRRVRLNPPAPLYRLGFFDACYM